MTNSTGRIAVRKNQNTGSTLPEIGKIKVGMKKKNSSGTEYPSSLDYFRPTGNFAQSFTKEFGETPRKLTIVFISDDLNEVCNERYECWEKGKKWGVGDGNTFSVWDVSEKKYIDGLSKDDPRVTKLKWDTMLTLRFVLVQLKGIMGYWTFQTKAKESSIPSIVKSFDWVREKASTIINFPFSLMVEKATGYNPGDAKSYPIVKLIPNFSRETVEHVAEFIADGGSLNKITTRFIEAAESLSSAPLLNAAPEVSIQAQPNLFDGEESK